MEPQLAVALRRERAILQLAVHISRRPWRCYCQLSCTTVNLDHGELGRRSYEDAGFGQGMFSLWWPSQRCPFDIGLNNCSPRLCFFFTASRTGSWNRLFWVDRHESVPLCNFCQECLSRMNVLLSWSSLESWSFRGTPCYELFCFHFLLYGPDLCQEACVFSEVLCGGST